MSNCHSLCVCVCVCVGSENKRVDELSLQMKNQEFEDIFACTWPATQRSLTPLPALWLACRCCSDLACCADMS